MELSQGTGFFSPDLFPDQDWQRRADEIVRIPERLLDAADENHAAHMREALSAAYAAIRALKGDRARDREQAVNP